MSAAKHTSPPWIRCSGPRADIRAGSELDGRKVASTWFPSRSLDREACDAKLAEDRANAALIVRAVNAHDDLLAALEALLAYEDDRPAAGTKGAEVYAAAEAAVAKARGL